MNVRTDPTGQGQPLTLSRFCLIQGILLACLLFSVLLACLWGMGGFDIGALLPFDPKTNPAVAILLDARLPRVLLGVLVGAALGSVGVAFQALLRNPLADPFIMGVSGGAALGGTLALVLFGPGLTVSFSLEGPAAFLGAVAATFLIYRVGRIGSRVDTTTVLLVGVVFNSFASAVIMFLKTIVSAQKTQELLVWLMGNLGYREYSTLLGLSVGVIAGIAILFCQTNNLNALSLGEQGASHLGVNVEKTKRIVFVTASLLVGLSVSVSGLVGFVGLMVPHILRMIVGPDHRLLLPASALAGASFLVLADLGTRVLFLPLTTEPPVGVITAFLGGPFFLFLLRKRTRHAFML
jgi:iron complex transport system permease protein